MYPDNAARKKAGITERIAGRNAGELTRPAAETRRGKVRQTQAAKPRQTLTAKLRQTQAAKLRQTLAAKPRQTLTAKLRQTQAAKLRQTLTAKLRQTLPAKPGQTLPAKPGQTLPAKPGQTPPGQSPGNGGIRTNFPANTLVFIVFLLYLAAKYLSGTDFLKNADPYLSIIVIQIGIYVLPCVIFCMLRENTGFAAYKIKPFKTHMLPFLFTGVFLLFFLSIVLKYVSIYVFGLYDTTLTVYSGRGDFLHLLLAGALVPAIAEEVLLRGVLFSEYEKVSGGAGAAIMTSVIFAMLHFSGKNFAVYFGAGLLLGTVTHVTGSVLPAVALHFINNLTMILTEKTLFGFASEKVGGILALVLLLTAFFTVLIIFLYQMEGIYLKKSLQKAKRGQEIIYALPMENTLFFALFKLIFSPMFLLSAAIFIAVAATA